MQKKREEKKTYLDMQTRMRCVRMALRADGLYGDVDGGSCRVGTDECKEKKQKKLTETWMDVSLWMCCMWMQIVLDVADGRHR